MLKMFSILVATLLLVGSIAINLRPQPLDGDTPQDVIVLRGFVMGLK